MREQVSQWRIFESYTDAWMIPRDNEECFRIRQVAQLRVRLIIAWSLLPTPAELRRVDLLMQAWDLVISPT
jgi:hypothetical protein